LPELAIGLDVRAAAEEAGGRSRVVRELLTELARRSDPHRYLLYSRRRWDAASLDERFEWRLIDAGEPFWHLRAAAAVNTEADVYLSTNSYLTAWFTRPPTALVVFDMIAFTPSAAPRRRAALIERASIRPALRRARAVICNSESARRDLVERFGVAGKVAVVPLAASADFARERSAQELDAVRKRYSLVEPFVLAAGTLEPRKNLVRLMQAFGALPAELRETHRLVLAGGKGWDYEPILAEAEAQGERVRLLGHVPDGDLAALYHLCEVFCYPSLYEGFGLPILEAMHAGAAVVTSATSSLPEVGGDAAVYVDPQDVDAIQNAIARLLGSPAERTALGERARRQAARFSWAATTARLLELLTALPRDR
jgi:glycosyltransferase involved in cell wall biosynthesis